MFWLLPSRQLAYTIPSPLILTVSSCTFVRTPAPRRHDLYALSKVFLVCSKRSRGRERGLDSRASAGRRPFFCACYCALTRVRKMNYPSVPQNSYAYVGRREVLQANRIQSKFRFEPRLR